MPRAHPLVPIVALAAALVPCVAAAQAVAVPPFEDERLREIAEAPSATRIEADIRTLAGFGTRHTLSDTVSSSRGIGAARRWIFAEFERISAACGGCLEVSYHRSLVPGDPRGRIPTDTWIVNVVAVLRGTEHPDRYVVMAGDIDSRASDALDGTSDAPGANDNASGMAGVLEAARVLSRYRFPSSILFAGLSGEEQGLFGGQDLARRARDGGWDLVGVLNNDMIGNVEGIDGVIDNRTFRIFSEPTPVTETEDERRRRRFYGGEVDGVSRQIARTVDRLTRQYLPDLEPMMVYRLDRFGRGGHHRPFNDAGFAGVRIMEAHEHYDRQHQDLRVENGRAYGDVLSGVNFEYAARLTAVNAVTLASLAWAPPAPTDVRIGGAVSPSTTLAWNPVTQSDLAGYVVWWRDTTAPRWQHRRFVGNVTRFTLENVVIDNWLFGVSSVSKDGHESPVTFPSALLAR